MGAFAAWYSQQRRKDRLAAMPFALAIGNAEKTVADDLDVTSRVSMTKFAPLDQGFGLTTVTLTGADAASFEQSHNTLFLKAGAVLAAGDLEVTIEAVNGGVTKEQDFTLHVEAA